MASIFRYIEGAITAPSRIKRAKERYDAAYSAYQQKLAYHESYTVGTKLELKALRQAKRNGMQSVIAALEFLKNYKQSNLKSTVIKNIDFRQEALSATRKIHNLAYLYEKNITIWDNFALRVLFVPHGLNWKNKADQIERDVERQLSIILIQKNQIERELAQQKITRQRASELRRTINRLINELQFTLKKAKPNLLKRMYRMVRQLVNKLRGRPRIIWDEDAIFQIAQITRALRVALDEPITSR